ncbi:OLC1v1037185C1 [Oldenlandia corymbosa var. corymbosa]|uniref:OLC1v1037185C1 n=1 Tax=Oldenlandia corymbosa var. corymbosa TaxID=529605 RepID=A0AAV1CWZ5_OLDCO|nr:OLC1v1037185C1 [Oldenlandia corymbosa var. corymbosa]
MLTGEPPSNCHDHHDEWGFHDCYNIELGFFDKGNQNPDRSKKYNGRKKRHVNSNSRCNSATTTSEHKQWRKVSFPSHRGGPDIDNVSGSFPSVSTDMDHDCLEKIVQSTMLDNAGGEATQNPMENAELRRQQQKVPFIAHFEDLKRERGTTDLVIIGEARQNTIIKQKMCLVECLPRVDGTVAFLVCSDAILVLILAHHGRLDKKGN